MRFALFRFRTSSVWLILACIVATVAIGGCNQSPPPPPQTSAPATSQTSAPSAPASAMTSDVQVKGDEALPPNHPPLPSVPAAHPTGPAMNPVEINRQIASQHANPSGKKKLEVAVPDSVKGRWASATLGVTTDGAEKVFKVAIGDKAPVGKNLELRLLHYLPAYTSDFQTATSSSNDEVNPAVQVQLSANAQVVGEGWVFQKLPDFNSFKSEQVKVRLISAEPTQMK